VALFRWFIPVTLTIAAIPVLAQKPVCTMVTAGEAGTILGTGVGKQDLGRTCIYKVKGSNVSLVVTTKAAATAAATKANVTKLGATLKDEPGLGMGAYSATLDYSARIYRSKAIRC